MSTPPPEKNLVWEAFQITREHRRRRFGHRSLVVWFTGLSGSGKSAISNQLEIYLHERGIATYLLDGDNVRQGLNKDLAFSRAGREENIRRVGEVAKLMVDAGLVVLASFISPFRKDRDAARALFSPGDFVEVYVRCPLEVCEARDPKGLYGRARAGSLPLMTGIDQPYEEPVNADIVLDSSVKSAGENALILIDHLEEHGLKKVGVWT